MGCVIRGACHWTTPEDIRELSDHSNLRHGSCAVIAVYAVRRAMRAQRSNRRRAPLLAVRSCSHPFAEAMRRTSCPSMGVTTARPPAVTRSFALPGVDPSPLLVLPPFQGHVSRSTCRSAGPITGSTPAIADIGMGSVLRQRCGRLLTLAASVRIRKFFGREQRYACSAISASMYKLFTLAPNPDPISHCPISIISTQRQCSALELCLTVIPSKTGSPL